MGHSSVENHEEATVESDSSDDDFDVRVPSSNEDAVEEPGTERSIDMETPGESADSNKPEEPHTMSEGDIVELNVNLPGLRRSSRTRNCPDRYGH